MCTTGSTASRKVVWRKPAQRGKAGLSQQEWDALPATLELRYVRAKGIGRDGKTKTLYLVTTLLDAKRYPGAEIDALYLERWSIELSAPQHDPRIQRHDALWRRQQRIDVQLHNAPLVLHEASEFDQHVVQSGQIDRRLPAHTAQHLGDLSLPDPTTCQRMIFFKYLTIFLECSRANTA